jgi:cAMP phosphodiesterase
MLVDALGQANLLAEKHRLSHKAIELLKKKANMLSFATDLGKAKLQEQRTELERQMQGELAAKEYQVRQPIANLTVCRPPAVSLQLH